MENIKEKKAAPVAEEQLNTIHILQKQLELLAEASDYCSKCDKVLHLLPGMTESMIALVAAIKTL